MITKKITILFFVFYGLLFSCSILPEKLNSSNHKNNCAIVTGHPEATKIGAQILQKGGNAIDASLATQLALAVCFPRAGNLGGGGFMVYRDREGGHYTLDFREKAPLKATQNMYLNENGEIIDSLSTYGHLAIGVPGTVYGIFDAYEKFGTLPLEDIFNPAIKLAENGFPITTSQANLFNSYRDEFIQFNPKNNYLVKETPWENGDILIQPDLANTLKIIRDNGKESFYDGVLTEKIISELNEYSILSKEDFKKYKSIWREPIVCEIENYKIIGMPPPSSGGIALTQLLQMANYYDFKKIEHNGKDYIHILSEMEKLVYADRSKYLGDSDFFEVPIGDLLDEKYNLSRFKSINFNKAKNSNNINYGNLSFQENEETTHFSIVDNHGNAVSVTTTLNANFGSKVFVNDLGFLLNNEMDDFSSKPGSPNIYGLIGSEANAIEPEKRMLSSMSPTILEKDNEPFLVVGSPGGATIITSVFQTIMNVTVFNMDIQSAVNAPRFHHQWLPDNIFLEKHDFSKNIIDSILTMGHKIKERSNMGNVNAILITKNIETGADNRGDNFGLELYVPYH